MYWIGFRKGLWRKLDILKHHGATPDVVVAALCRRVASASNRAGSASTQRGDYNALPMTSCWTQGLGWGVGRDLGIGLPLGVGVGRGVVVGVAVAVAVGVGVGVPHGVSVYVRDTFCGGKAGWQIQKSSV
jgi:hypothetical protein